MAVFHHRVRSILGVLLVALVIPLLAACSASGSSSGSGAYPNKAVELGVTASAGGGLDQFARAIEEGLIKDKEKVFPGTLTINYYEGSTTGMARLYEQKGNGYLMMVNTNRVYFTPMFGQFDKGIKDYTPVARLASDFVTIAVRKDSPYKTAKELFDALKKDPKAATFAYGTGAYSDQLFYLRGAKAAGVDVAKLNLVVFPAGGEVMSAVLGGQVQVMGTGLSEAAEQAKAGDIRILAVSSPERIKGALKDVPTLKEQGIDIVHYHWRGVFGPPEMPKDALTYWTDTFKKMYTAPAWKTVMERTGWGEALLVGDDFTKALLEEEKTASDLLGSIGLLKK